MSMPELPEHPEAIMNRQAGALAEVQRIHADNTVLRDKSDQDRRTIERLEDRCALLVDELNKAQQEGKIYQRKLIRLAAAMSGIGRLTQDADEIMRSAVEYEESETARQAQEEQRSAQELINSLPPRQE